MNPVQIQNGILQMMDKVANKGNELPYTELCYYKLRLSQEVTRLNGYMFNPNCPVAYQSEINDMINKVKASIETICTYMVDKKVDTKHDNVGMSFSNLTKRLNNIKHL